MYTVQKCTAMYYHWQGSDQLNLNNVAGTSVPCSAHSHWHLVARFENLSGKHLTCGNFYIRRDNLEKLRKTNNPTGEKKNTITQVAGTSVPSCPAHSSWHLTVVASVRSETAAENLSRSQFRKLVPLSIEKCHTFRMLGKPVWLSLLKWHRFDSFDMAPCLQYI